MIASVTVKTRRFPSGDTRTLPTDFTFIISSGVHCAPRGDASRIQARARIKDLMNGLRHDIGVLLASFLSGIQNTTEAISDEKTRVNPASFDLTGSRLATKAVLFRYLIREITVFVAAVPGEYSRVIGVYWLIKKRSGIEEDWDGEKNLFVEDFHRLQLLAGSVYQWSGAPGRHRRAQEERSEDLHRL